MNFFTMIEALWPPNPKLLLIASLGREYRG